MYTFFTIGESQDEGPDDSEQIEVCLQERPGKSECETCGKFELSQSRQKMDVRFGLRTVENRIFLRKKTLAGMLAGMAGVVGVGGGRWDCWAAKTFGFDT